jgi:RNA polymerase sigma factor (sigma-70 family)
MLPLAMERLQLEGYTVPETTPDRAVAAVCTLCGADPEDGIVYRDKHFETGVGLVRWLGSAFPRGAEDGAFPMLELVRSLLCEQRVDGVGSDLSIEVARGNLDVLIGQSWDSLIGFCRRRGGDEEAATVALGRAFIKFWSPEAADRFAGQSRVGTMLCSFARLVILEQERGRKRTVLSDGVDPAGPPEPPGPTARGEIRRAYEECLGQLPPREQIIVDLHVRYRMTGKAIAERLGCVKSNISNALAMGMPRLRGCMESKKFFSSGS